MVSNQRPTSAGPMSKELELQQLKDEAKIRPVEGLAEFATCKYVSTNVL